MKDLTISPIQTSIFQPGDDLIEFIIRHVPSSVMKEKTILIITSKIVSLAEGRLVPQKSIDKKALIRQEAEVFLGEIGYEVSLTIKQGLLIAAAGIDESNSVHDDFILHPKDPFVSAQIIHQKLKAHYGLQNLGIILTDSKTGPLRLGVVGVALSFAGFKPLKNMIGQKDLFDRPLKVTKINVADSLAGIAVFTMGEAAERKPLALIHNANVDFTDDPMAHELIVDPSEDMYLPLYKHLIQSEEKSK